MKRLVVITASVATLATIFVPQATATEPISREVPAAVLRDLGLGGLQPVSDTQAMKVRGSSSFVVSGGSSFVWGQLQFMGQINTYVEVESDTNQSYSTATNGAPSQVTTMHGSMISDGLNVVGMFSGSFSGFAGSTVSPFAGFATAFGQ